MQVVLQRLAAKKATMLGHVLSTWSKSFHRKATVARCTKCYALVAVLTDTNPLSTEGRAIKEECK